MDGSQQQDWHEAQAVRADLESEARAEQLDARPYVDPAELPEPGPTAYDVNRDVWGGPLQDYGDDDEVPF